MASDIYAKPHSAERVRYFRAEEEEWQEREVEIYESAGAIGDHLTEVQSHKQGPDTEKRPPPSCAVAVCCLGALSFLTIAGIIFLSVQYISVKDQLQTRYEKLSSNYSKIEEKMSDMAVNNSQLQDEVKQLKRKLGGKVCPDGWQKCGCGCYFKSNEKKTWSESQRDCWAKGSDLMIINNKEEQKFVTELSKGGESWIGLRATSLVWKWVDGSSLTEPFWEKGYEPKSDRNYYGACCDQQGNWTRHRYNDEKNWICEK